MRLIRSALAGLLALSAVATASAQQFPTVPDKTVIGRIGIGGQSGPSQAIPFATLFSSFVSASGVPNAVLSTDGSSNGRFSTVLPGALTIPSPVLTGSISAPFGLNLPLFGGGSGSPIAVGSLTGNTTKVATGSGTYTATNCIKSDASGNLVDAGAPCGTGTNVSTTQDFIAGTGFTAGTTTSLTVSSTPINAASSYVTFDGVVQSHNTFSLAGSTYTFSAAIPLNTKVVEIGWLSTAVLPTFVTSFGGATGALLAGTGITVSGQTVNVNMGSVDNLLPNVQWQLWSGLQYITKQNAAGTASQTPLSCSGFSTSNGGPAFTCSNTQTLRANDLIITSIQAFWGFTGAGYITCAAVQCTQSQVTASRVTSVTPNTSVLIASPGFGGVSPTSSAAVTVSPIAPGDLGSSTNGADGWTKTSTLIATVDDWGAAATPASTVYPGCERPLLLRKGITGNELYQYTIPQTLLAKFAGRTVTLGMAVYQRVQGGANTWNSFIVDNASSNFSANGTGSGLGGYQFLSVTHTFPATITSGSIGFQANGNAGDVFDICLPTAAFVPSMVQSQLKQNSFERIKATSHWNPPLLTPYIIQFPSSATFGLFTYNNNDIEALSFGSVRNSVQYVHCKLEWTSTSVGKNVFFGANVNTSNGLTFGLQAATQVSGVVFPTSDTAMPLYHDGTFAAYSELASLVPTAGTFDCGDVEVSPGNSVN